METYNPILSRQLIMKRGMGSPRPRPEIGVAHVLYGRDTEPLVLRQGARLSLGESMFGGYTTAFMVDLSKRRLAWMVELPCRDDVHRFTATFTLTCWVIDPAIVVRENIEDAGAVLWSVVLRHAREVSRQYNAVQTEEAEHAIAERLAKVVLHPAFGAEPVGVQLAPDPQAVEIGRRNTNTSVWNTIIGSPLAAAYLAEHPGDIPGALAVVREELRQHDEAADSYRAVGGRIGPEMKAMKKELFERQNRTLGLQRRTEFSASGVRPALPPREMPASEDELEDDDEDELVGKSNEPSTDAQTNRHQDPAVILHHGNRLFEKGDFEGAIAAYDRVLRIDPDNVTARASRGRAHGMCHRFGEALADLDRALQLDPDSVIALASRGEVYRLLERFDEAFADLDRALQLDPDNLLAWASSGKAHRDLENFGSAVDRSATDRSEDLWVAADAQHAQRPIPDDHPRPQLDDSTRRQDLPVQERGRDVQSEVTLDFEEAVRGATIPLQLTGPAPCHLCNGSGGKPGTLPRSCPNCNGRGTEIRSRELKVRLPSGVSDGATVRLKGQGEPGQAGASAGDLIVKVHVPPHPLFRRRGNDLTITVPVTFAEAALGAQLSVPTFDGPVMIEVPGGTASGRTFRIRGRGVPGRDRDAPTGDLLVTVEVAVPKTLPDRARDLLLEHDAASEFSPRQD